MFCQSMNLLKILLKFHQIDDFQAHYSNFVTCNFCYVSLYMLRFSIQCVPEKRKPINQVNFSENYNDLSEIVYIVTKVSLSSFFRHQLQDVLAMPGQARTISNCDVKIDLRRIGI